MQINKQRLQLWLDEKVDAYNDGTTESIALIKELCKYSKNESIPSGAAKFYASDMASWYSYDGPEEGMPRQPVSWFFEPDNEPEQTKSTLDRAETARMILMSMVGSRDLSNPPDVARTAVCLTDALINILNQK